MVSILSLISYSSSLLSKRLETVRSAPNTISITVILIFHSFYFSIFAKVQVFVYDFVFFSFPSVVCKNSKNLLDRKFIFFLSTIGLVFQPGLGDPFLYQNAFIIIYS